MTYGFFGGTNTSGLFRIDPTTGVIRLINSQINFDVDEYELNVTATDDGKCCMEARASVDPKEVHTSTALVVVSKVQVEDKNDNSPYFERSLYEAEVDENEDIGHTVLTINANDKDECEYDIYQDMFYPLIFSTSSFKTPLRNHKRQFWRSVFCEQNNWGYQCGWTH